MGMPRPPVTRRGGWGDQGLSPAAPHQARLSARRTVTRCALQRRRHAPYPCSVCLQPQLEVLHLPARWKTAQGPGAGLSNLGNTCYFNSVLQVGRGICVSFPGARGGGGQDGLCCVFVCAWKGGGGWGGAGRGARGRSPLAGGARGTLLPRPSTGAALCHPDVCPPAVAKGQAPPTLTSRMGAVSGLPSMLPSGRFAAGGSTTSTAPSSPSPAPRRSAPAPAAPAPRPRPPSPPAAPTSAPRAVPGVPAAPRALLPDLGPLQGLPPRHLLLLVLLAQPGPGPRPALHLLPAGTAAGGAAARPQRLPQPSGPGAAAARVQPRLCARPPGGQPRAAHVRAGRVGAGRAARSRGGWGRQGAGRVGGCWGTRCRHKGP